MNKKTTKQTKRLPNGSWLSKNGSRIDSKLFMPLALIAIKYDNTFIERGELPTKQRMVEITKQMKFMESGITYDKVVMYLKMIATGKALASGYNDTPVLKTELNSIRTFLIQLSK
jgi:hypothetical protein